MATQQKTKVNYLSSGQKLLIEEISKPITGVTREQATVSIYLYFHRLAKPENELKYIVAAVAPQLLTEQRVSECMRWMKEQGLAQEIDDRKHGMRYVEIADDFEITMEKITRINALAGRLKEEFKKRPAKVYVNPKGIIGEEKDNYTDLLDAIQFATDSVKYTVLTTMPYEATVRALKAAAQNGVEIQILVADDAVVRDTQKDKKSVAPLWDDAFKDVKNVQVRVYGDMGVADLCSSVLIDNDILRFDVFDPTKSRSLDGYLLEIRNSEHENLNIIKWFTAKFDEAWENACTTGEKPRIKHTTVSLMIAWGILLVCVFVYFQFRNDADQLAQGFTDEILLMLIGGSGEYIIPRIWLKMKAIGTAFVRALQQES